MKKILVKTETVISTHIHNGGLKVSIKSPEIGRLVRGGDIIPYIWHNFETISHKGDSSQLFTNLVKYFLTSEKGRQELYKKIIDQNFWLTVFDSIKRKSVNNGDYPAHDIVITNDKFIFHRGMLNLKCLVEAEEKEKSFVYSGIFNKELVSQSIAPLLRIYAAGLIQFFR